MATLVLDERLRKELNGATEPIAFLESDGRTVGHYLPEDLYKKWLYSQAIHEVDTAALDRAALETGGRTLAEIQRERGWK